MRSTNFGICCIFVAAILAPSEQIKPETVKKEFIKTVAFLNDIGYNDKNSKELQS